VEELKSNVATAPSAEEMQAHSSDEDEEEESPAPSSKKAEAQGGAPSIKSVKKGHVDKTKDPLRLAAHARAVADLAPSTVTW
jgi:hypothetical protein